MYFVSTKLTIKCITEFRYNPMNPKIYFSVSKIAEREAFIISKNSIPKYVYL